MDADTFKKIMDAAYKADDAFEAAVNTAGYKSRWDWNKKTDQRPVAAYDAKVAADELLHQAFEQTRKKEG